MHASTELRNRAARMVSEACADYDTETAALRAVAVKLGINPPETLRNWGRQADVDAGKRAGTTPQDAAEIKRLRREVAELRRANEILKAAAGFVAAGLARPQRFS
ncbi:transposase [Actinomadura rubrisoli]|uniref:Transposase n=1 Tax=Actinomadura rubrisoli TaxID=2530368 RepID=A0A4R5A8S8_9ACTN|nr:transposase [Actinomadura rubrisoli]TDD66082.1 transposase [Actinomadura rubrisoli]